MKKEIIIENLKGIKNLKFPIPEKKGLYLLVGPNEIGKSTLLLCMHRICNNLAFATGFKDTSTWNEADQYQFFGGVLVRTVCDNLKTGVVKHPKEGDIILNEAYESLDNYYCTAIMPTGVRKPKHYRRKNVISNSVKDSQITPVFRYL